MVLLCLLTAGVQSLFPQQNTPATNAADHRADFFSGTVVALTGSSISVTRRGLGKDAGTRTFQVDASTHFEGKTKPTVKSRVTVRYEATQNGDRAVTIIVR